MPVEQTGESTAGGGDAHRSLPTPFLTKTYQLVDDPAVDDVISWNEDGSTFIVWRPAEFARDLLPKYFKHNNFSSFVRQLNTYGFRKIVPDRWEFANDCFRRGEKRLLCDIHRRKISPTVTATGVPVPAAAIPMVMNGSPSNSGEEQVLSSNSPPVAVSVSAVVARTSCTSTSELLDENERLRRENQQLNQELTRMKSLCNNILVLMTNYANSHHDNNNNNSNINNNNNVGGSGCVTAFTTGCVGEKPLDLMPITRYPDEPEAAPSSAAQNRVKMEEEIREMSPRLFGVPIGSKRIRREEVDEQVHQQQHQEPQPQEQQQQIGSDGVKSEPWDTSSNQQESTWMNTNCRSNERSCN